MASPVSLDHASNTPVTEQSEQENFAGRTWCTILRGDPSLPEDQRGLVRVINLCGLSLCAMGTALLGITIPLSDDSSSDSELMYPNYRVISSLRFPCLVLGASALYFAKITTTYLKKTNESQTEVSPELRDEIEKRAKESVYIRLQNDNSLENGVIDPLSLVKIDMSRTEQGELVQQNSIRHRIVAMQTSQKGLLASLGIGSICIASIAAVEFFKPDPPPDSLMPSFVDSTVVANDTQKWSLGIISLASATATMLYTKYFLKNQQQKSTITPEMASIIQNSVEQEIQNAIPGPSGLQTGINHF
ncbi:MAG TPA: hypothetical protein VGZ69_00005 [Candidatus Rhabdochlamydia sp.]|jgi:hypothetical protein|nr:hypothetical protein [Candidatus Rhabdochlamydia sp.]